MSGPLGISIGFHPGGELRPGTANPLLTDLIEHWSLEEVSGNRVGSHQGIVLSDTGSNGNATGKVGNAADFQSSDRLETTEADADTYFTFGGTPSSPFSLACWANFDDASVNRCLMAMFGVSNQREWRFERLNNNNLAFLFTHGGGEHTNQFVDTVSGANWWFCCAKFDPGTGTYVKAVEDTEALFTDVAWQFESIADDMVARTDIPLSIGEEGQGNRAMDGQIDEAGVWGRLLDDSEFETLFNAGAGLAYPFSGWSASGGGMSMLT